MSDFEGWIALMDERFPLARAMLIVACDVLDQVGVERSDDNVVLAYSALLGGIAIGVASPSAAKDTLDQMIRAGAIISDKDAYPILARIVALGDQCDAIYRDNIEKFRRKP